MKLFDYSGFAGLPKATKYEKVRRDILAGLLLVIAISVLCAIPVSLLLKTNPDISCIIVFTPFFVLPPLAYYLVTIRPGSMIPVLAPVVPILFFHFYMIYQVIDPPDPLWGLVLIFVPLFSVLVTLAIGFIRLVMTGIMLMMKRME